MATPSTPTNFNLQTGQQSNFLSWDQTTTGATTFLVQRSLDNVTFSLQATVTGTPLNNFYLDSAFDASLNPTGVKAGIQYYYQVAAMNISGTSSYTSSQGIVPAPIGQVSLGWVRAMAQARADLVNSQFISIPEWNSYISNSQKDMQNFLTEKYGDDYLIADPYSYTTSTSQSYPLPADFYKLILAEVALNAGDPNSWVTIRQYNRIQQNLYNFPNIYTFYGVTNLRYRLTGSNIYLIPTPQAGTTFRIWYVPRPKILMADTDIIDGISGYEEFVIIDAARKARQKQESDTTELTNECLFYKQRIAEAAANRNVSEPQTISDSRVRNFAWGENDGYGNGGNLGW